MIYYIEGRFTEVTPTHVVVDCGGVGYIAHISLNTYSTILKRDGGRILTHLQIKEDGHVLYGFNDEEERNIFLLLISVNGIGCNTARMILSSLNPAEIRYAILNGNLTLIKSIKGIGDKTAQRLIIELKDKVGKGGAAQSTMNVLLSLNKNREEALQALTMLGFSKLQSDKALEKVAKSNAGADLSVEQLIKQALSNM